MLFSIQLSREVETDLAEIFSYFASENPLYAKRLSRALAQKLRSLKKTPKRCPIAPESGVYGHEIRHLIYPPYRILYKVAGNKVFILRVIHGARVLDPELLDLSPLPN